MMQYLDRSNVATDDMQRANEIQSVLRVLYIEANRPNVSATDQRRLSNAISDLECELSELLGNRYSALTPAGYYVPGSEAGTIAPSQSYEMDAALILGDGSEEPKKFPWLAVVMGGAAMAYFTMKG